MSQPNGYAPAGEVATRGLTAGASLVELTIALALVASTAALSAPVLASSLDTGRARQAAQYLAAQCRSARTAALARSAASALVFDLDPAGARWRIRRCVDGNGNGVRRAEISTGKDVCIPGSVELGEVFAGVTLAIDASMRDPDGNAGSTDAVRFGTSDVASFTPAGTATAGTVFLRSAGGVQFAVRVAGPTGRVRILRFDTGAERWVEV